MELYLAAALVFLPAILVWLAVSLVAFNRRRLRRAARRRGFAEGDGYLTPPRLESPAYLERGGGRTSWSALIDAAVALISRNRT